jgi:hypothetical protein
VVEQSKEGSREKIVYDEDREIEKNVFAERMNILLTNKGEYPKYTVFQPNEIEGFKKQIKRAL